MEKKYYLREKGKNVSYTFEELKNKNLKRDTKIWIEGSSTWQKLDRIPELNNLLSSIPPKNKSHWVIYPIILILLVGLAYGGWNYYQKNKIRR